MRGMLQAYPHGLAFFGFVIDLLASSILLHTMVDLWFID